MPLHLAAVNNHDIVIRKFMETISKDIYVLDRTNEIGETPLLIAVNQGYVKSAKALLDCGCKPMLEGKFIYFKIFYHLINLILLLI